MFLDRVEKPIQKSFMFISALTLVKPLADMPIGSVQDFHVFRTFTTYYRLFGRSNRYYRNKSHVFFQAN